jgi:putative SOS response-associated peptidase YedK
MSRKEQFREKHCLIPTDGFYEWLRQGTRKYSLHFALKSGRPFGFAGLWDIWRAEGSKPLLTCCLITTDANELVKPVHDRMPVIFARESYGGWLDPDTPEDRLLALLKPHPADELVVREASTVVNSAKYDGPECLGAA